MSSANAFNFGKPKILSSGEGLRLVNSFPQNLDLRTLKKKPLENIVGKGENAGYQHFLLFPTMFSTLPKQISVIYSHLLCRLQMRLIWTGLKIYRLVKSKTSFMF